MKTIIRKGMYLGLLAISIVGCTVSSQNKSKDFSVIQAKSALDHAVNKYRVTMPVWSDSTFPKTYENNQLITSDPFYWSSGYYPGTLWYLYEYAHDSVLKTEAMRATIGLEKVKYNTNHHAGLILYPGFGNGYRLMNHPKYKEIMLIGAHSLSTQYSPKLRVIKSEVDDLQWKYPVYICNMMNLELLMWAHHADPDVNNLYGQMAWNHANMTLKNQFKEDNSAIDFVDYDPTTGEASVRQNVFGLNNESTWARGQAWALYGFTMIHRETQDKAFLDQAILVADFMLNHPNMPEDLVPYWDFDAKDIPNSPKDASAAAIMASSLLELSGFVGDSIANVYIQAASKALTTLSSAEYTAPTGVNGHFILMHSVGNFPNGSDINVPLNYEDYYYVEALLRYLAIKDGFVFQSARY